LSPAIIFFSAFILAMALTPIVRAGALRLGIVDHPERRKMHQVPVPLLGGAGIVISFFVVTVGVLLWAPELFGEEITKLPAILGGGLAVGLLGLYDDWRGTRVWFKFAFQVAAAAIVVTAGVQARLFTNPFGDSFDLGWLGVPLTILWIVGVTNAMNLIDGLDGLAAGVSTIASLSLCAVGALMDQPLVAILALTLGGASLGFLPFNFYPARVFLGDTGSMFLGFVLAGLGVIGSLKSSAATVLLIPIVVLGIPVFDTLWAIQRRARRRVSPFEPDRDHIHHRLVRVGLHHRHVVLILYFLAAFLGVTAFVMVQLPRQTGLLFAVLLAVGGVLGVSTLQYIEQHLEERLAAANGSKSGNKLTPPPEVAKPLWQSVNAGRQAAANGYQIGICEVGGFREGLAGSQAFGTVAQRIREVLGRRMRVYAVGAYMQEDRSLLVVLKTEPIGEEGHALVVEALKRFFEESAGEWGGPGAFPVFRWIRKGREPGSEEPFPRRRAAGGE
jgi:UDP-GlcNAc:undecaprenyl-phosphate GlcNAc-1-phosphate transferase